MKRTLATLSAVLLLASPFAASALTSAEMQTKLQSLMAQIAALQAQLAALQSQTTSPTTGCPAFLPPPCQNGVLVSRGTDGNGCSLGYGCKPTTKCGVNSYSVRDACGTEGAYRGASVQCHDGTTYSLGGTTSCKPTAVWKSMADAQCVNRCSASSAPAVQMTIASSGPSPFSFGRGQYIPLKGVVSDMPSDTQLNFEIERQEASGWVSWSKSTYINHAMLWNQPQKDWTYDRIMFVPGNNDPAGVYRVHAYIQKCPTQGCEYNPDAPGYGPTDILAQSSSETFRLTDSQAFSVSGTLSAREVRNGLESVDVSWNIQNAPVGASMDIVLDGLKPNSAGLTEYPLTSRFPLTDGYRLVNLREPQQTLPTSGTIRWSPGLADAFVPTNGHLSFRVWGSDGSVLGSDFDPLAVTTGPTASTTAIRVTAPNGGEQWTTGELNTVTWSPYGYNPDVNPARDVTAYLERLIGEKENGEKAFEIVGKVEETGKASIHWMSGELGSAQCSGPNPCARSAVPGRYYIRVVNNRTGAWDRSDAPFTLLERQLDIKINGSDGPVTLAPGAAMNVSWTSTGMSHCRISGATKESANDGGKSYSASQYDVAPRGSMTMYSIAFNPWTVILQCQKDNGSTVNDFVVIQPLNVPIASASATVLSPNGGELYAIDGTVTVKWTHKALSSYAVALYRNDQWFAWINKDLAGVNVGDLYSIDFTPAKLGVTGSEGAVWKIYVTGQKADGTGYVDDKSDAAFTFVSSSGPTATRAVCGLFRGGTDSARNMIASPNPATSVEDTDTACLKYCDASGPKEGDVCMRGTAVLRTYATVPPPTPAANKVPVGNVDIAALNAGNKSYLSGWAYDPDAPATPLSIRVQKDGADIATVSTDIMAPTVNARYRLTGTHRFRYLLPTESRIGQYRIFAIDANTGESTELKNSPKTVGKGAPCIIDGVTVPNGLSRVLYSAESATAPATCASLSQRRTCTDGLLGGDESFEFATCKNGRVGETSAAGDALDQLASALQAILALLGGTR